MSRHYAADAKTASQADVTLPAQCAPRLSFIQWLDALADGECDRETLLRGLHDEMSDRPETGWELLGSLDQYYRRRRIGVEDFRYLNSQLQALQMGRAKGASLETPAPEIPSGPPPETNPQPPPEVLPPTPAPSPVPQPERAARPGSPTPPPRNRPIGLQEVLRNRYRVTGILGRGGMGMVYAAVDQYRLNESPGDQHIAIKVLHTEVMRRPRLLTELRAEFQCLQSLSHPNIVRVHEFDRDGELAFFTMEQLNGSTLGKLIAGQPTPKLARPHAWAIIHHASAAVAYAHSRGIVHGDLNPGNVFITQMGEVRVLDFGAATRSSAPPPLSVVDGCARISVATPGYASCEVLEGSPPTLRDDVYAMACLSYVLLAGVHPFDGRSALAARKAHLKPRRPAGLGTAQWRALKAGLSFERKQRPADMQVWMDRSALPTHAFLLPPLAELARPRPSRRTPRPWLAAASVAFIAGVGWWTQARYGSMSAPGNATERVMAKLLDGISGRPDPSQLGATTGPAAH